MNFFSHRYALWLGGKNAVVSDADLASHDRRFHPNGFDPEHETCNKRAELAKADKGDVLLPGEGDDKGSDKPLVSAAEDAAYMDAVKRGDMETARDKLRDVVSRIVLSGKSINMKFNEEQLYQVAKANGLIFPRGHVLKVNTSREIFGKIPKPLVRRWARLYYTYNLLYRHASNGEQIEALVKVMKPYDKITEKIKKQVEGIYQKEGYASTYPRLVGNQQTGYREVGGVRGKNELDRSPLETIDDEWRQKHYNDKNKTFDTVWYDEDGNVIPLSRRFDDGGDIRGDMKVNLADKK